MDKRIATICGRGIQERVFPGCTVGYVHDGTLQVLPFGRLAYEDDAPTVTGRTVYDVASLTKSIPTSSIILKLVEEGRLSLDDQAIEYMPELQNDYRDQILIRHLLTYTVIFDIGRPLSEVATEAPGRILATIFSAPLVAPPIVTLASETR